MLTKEQAGSPSIPTPHQVAKPVTEMFRITRPDSTAVGWAGSGNQHNGAAAGSPQRPPLLRPARLRAPPGPPPPSAAPTMRDSAPPLHPRSSTTPISNVSTGMCRHGWNAHPPGPEHSDGGPPPIVPQCTLQQRPQGGQQQYWPTPYNARRQDWAAPDGQLRVRPHADQGSEYGPAAAAEVPRRWPQHWRR